MTKTRIKPIRIFNNNGDIVEKSCSSCGVLKPASEFHKHSTTKDRLRPNCKQCRKSISKSNNLKLKLIDHEVPAKKKCPNCGIVKNSTNFQVCSYNKTGLASHCFSCSKKYHKKYNKAKSEEFHEKVNKLKLNPCEICGITYSPEAMDFDHLDPSQKSHCISEMKTMPWAKVAEEISICRLLCANCHMLHTRKQWDDFKANTLQKHENNIANREKSNRDDGDCFKCNKCFQYLKKTQFSVRKTGRVNSTCKSCDYIRKYKELKKRLRDINILKSNPCSDCKVTFSPQCMEYDHLDPNEKHGDIAHLMARRNMSVVLKEIEKCDLVCRNCHRVRTKSRMLSGL